MIILFRFDFSVFFFFKQKTAYEMRISDWSSDVCSSDLGTNIIKTRTVGDVFGFNSGDITKSKTDSFVYALNGQWEVGDSAQITADLAYQDSKTQSQFFAMRTSRVAPQIMVAFNTGNAYPRSEKRR